MATLPQTQDPNLGPLPLLLAPVPQLPPPPHLPGNCAPFQRRDRCPCRGVTRGWESFPRSHRALSDGMCFYKPSLSHTKHLGCMMLKGDGEEVVLGGGDLREDLPATIKGGGAHMF